MNLLDKAISVLSPLWAMKRGRARQALALLDSSYKGASRNTRALATWYASSGSANTDLAPGTRKTLMHRSRDAYRNCPLGRAAVLRPTANVIGTGLKFHSNVDYKTLGITAEQGKEYSQQIEREFNYYASTPDECDFDRQHDFYQLQYHAFFSSLLSGDSITLTPMIRRPGCLYNLKFQVIEADRLDSPQGDNVPHEKIKDGVELDKNGVPVAVWIRETHPGEYLSSYEKRYSWKRKPIFGSRTGRRRVMHLFKQERPGQVRGEPFLAPILNDLKQWDRYSDSEMMSAVISSYFTTFVTSPDPNAIDGLNLMAQEPDDGHDAVEPYASSAEEIRMGPGAVCGLQPGEEVKFANPSRPNAQYEPFLSVKAKEMGAATGVPFEDLMLYFTSSYSAARGALLKGWQFTKERRKLTDTKWCRPGFLLWLDEAVAIGRLKLPSYGDPVKRRAYAKGLFVGDARGAIDEVKEIDAAMKRIELGVSNRHIETANLMGLDWEDVDDVLAMEEARLQERKPKQPILDGQEQEEDKEDAGDDREKKDNDSDDT